MSNYNWKFQKKHKSIKNKFKIYKVNLMKKKKTYKRKTIKYMSKKDNSRKYEVKFQI